MPSRRLILSMLTLLTGAGALASLSSLFRTNSKSGPKVTTEESSGETAMKNTLKAFSLGQQWPVQEPFIFCAHHHDLYPKGDKNFAPPASDLKGRDMGQDFDPNANYRMYHGEVVPGFPVHPHRGFETITIVRKGYVDHADSLGAAGRYGEGDVQWMTAGTGVQHSEMFPLLKQEESNTLELFQIWLNLPKKSKTVAPHFGMFWSELIPRTRLDANKVTATVIAGDFENSKALAPPPNSWASDPANDVAILLFKFEAGGRVKIPKSAAGVKRSLYFFEGHELQVNGETLRARTGANVAGDQDLELVSQSGAGEVLLLQAKPIGEPVVQHGPFVMNSREDIIQTISDYQKTGFGGWPWNRHDMVHGPTIERFAKFPDGRVEKPKKA